MFGRLFLLGWCAVALAQSGASIEGRVVTTSGAPVRRASVSLRLASGPVMMSGPNISANFTVESDGDGRFTFQNLNAGGAIVAVSRPGYSATNENVTLTAGQRLTGLTIKMARLGVIYGKVVDEYGDPFSRLNVGLFRKIYENGWKWQQQGSASTAPDGTYALGDLQQGRYYVAAMDMQYSAGSQTTRYIQTFYPSATEPSGATAIDIEPEAELRGVDIRMQRGKMFRVSGKLTSTEALQGASVSLIPRETTAVALMRPSGGVNIKDNTFVVERVPEGSYYATVQTQFRPGADPKAPMVMLTGRELVTVSGRDVENLVIALSPGIEISGRVRIEGTQPAQAQQPRIMLRATDQGSGGLNTTTNPDGTFTIRNVIPGTYQVTALNMPNAYLSSVRYEGQDVTWSPITIGSGAAGTIEAVFKTDGAKLTGIVRDEKGDLLTEARLTLWASSTNSGYVMTSMTDRTGTFRFQNLPPGEYRVAAWDKKAAAGQTYSGIVQAPEFLRLFDATAATVRVDASSEQTKDLNAIPLAVIDAAITRLP